MDKYENIEKVKRLDFDRLDMLVSERIGALKLLCVYLLAQFLESVKIEENT